jgi:SpoVK/Ycf46/Vps4 family AAA+-type ATPase
MINNINNINENNIYNIMHNKRKNNIIDPKRINNYNKFLSTLDSGTIVKPVNSFVFPQKNQIKTEETIKTEEMIKNEIDKIIDKIYSNFSVNNYSSTNFTGLTSFGSCCIDNDPNYYRDIIKKQSIFDYNSVFTNPNQIKSEKYIIPQYINPQYIIPQFVPQHMPQYVSPSQSPQNQPKPVEITQTIDIDVEINNIGDILKVIETYKIDPSIKYNINIKALHDIKDPLIELNNMIGMKTLKNNIVDQILYFVQGLHKNDSYTNDVKTGDFMHTVIYGPPGTGKTEIAKIMGKIYSKIGILKKGTFKKVSRSDLIAGYLGQTASKTQDVIKEALGGVLFIDEAYSLGNSEKRDSFAKECIDTLCEALSEHKDNLMVIIAGYEKELKECFFKFNQGLDSRFTWRFKTDDYSHEDLYNIFLKKVNDIGWSIEENENINSDWFKNNKDYFKFYGRDIENILAKTKIAHGKRVFCKSENEKKKITLTDLNKGFDMYLKNEDVKNRKQETEMKNYITSTLYS